MIDKHDAPKGYIAIKEPKTSCNGCEFNGNCFTVNCILDERADQQHVIFIKKKSKKKQVKQLRKEVHSLLVRITELENKLDELLARS
jgi:hypothetical protein